ALREGGVSGVGGGRALLRLQSGAPHPSCEPRGSVASAADSPSFGSVGGRHAIFWPARVERAGAGVARGCRHRRLGVRLWSAAQRVGRYGSSPCPLWATIARQSATSRLLLHSRRLAAR